MAASALKSLAVPVDVEPMEAKLVAELPEEPGWQFEPKWDGFRCLAFRAGDQVDLRAKSGKPLGRYFPEVVAMLMGLKPSRFVIDGELAIPVGDTLSFDALQMRIHPAESRIKKLAVETPAILILFDMLLDTDGNSLIEDPLVEAPRGAGALLQDGAADRRLEALALHRGPRRGRALAGQRARRARRRRRQAERRRLSPRRARHAQGQAAAHGGLRGRRLPLRERQPRGRLAAARSLRRCRQAGSCRFHRDHHRRRAPGAHQTTRSADRRHRASPAKRREARAAGAPSAAANGSR